MKKLNQILVVLALLVQMIIPLQVKASTRHVSIGVKDSNGDIIQYANAKLTKRDTEYTKLVNSGMAEFFDVPDGNYTLEVSADTYEIHKEEIVITTDKRQNFDVVLKKKEAVIENPEVYGSKLNVTINYFNENSSASIGSTPDKVEKKTFDMYLGHENTIDVELEESSYVMNAILSGVTYKQDHFKNHVSLSVTAKKDVYNVTLYVLRNHTSRLEVVNLKYEDDSWSEFLGYSDYLDDGVNPKAHTTNMIDGKDFSVKPENLDDFELYNGYTLYYVNGGVWYQTTLEEWGLSMDGKTGEITGKGPSLSGNEFLFLYYYYVKKEGKVDVSYVDLNGNVLRDNIVLTGKVGKDYQTELLDFDDYELVKVDGNKDGKYSSEDTKVTYVYRLKNSKEAINYVDTGIDSNGSNIKYLVTSVVLLLGSCIFKRITCKNRI